MSYPRTLARFRSELWAIQPEALESMHQALLTHQRNPAAAKPLQSWKTRADWLDDDGDDAMPSSPACGGYRPELLAPGVALISVSGIIGKRLSFFESLCGGYDLDQLAFEVDQVAADRTVHSVVFDFDTPGGSVTGLWEAAQKIAALSETKNTVAYTETLRASAGEYLASQCNTVTATRSATVGSIGTILSWVSAKGAMEKEGFELIVFKGGQFKDMGADNRDLTDEEKTMLQGNVDTHYAEFKAMMTAKGRQIADSTMQGQVFRGSDALALGLVDEVVSGLDEVVAALTPTN